MATATTKTKALPKELPQVIHDISHAPKECDCCTCKQTKILSSKLDLLSSIMNQIRRG